MDQLFILKIDFREKTHFCSKQTHFEKTSLFFQSGRELKIEKIIFLILALTHRLHPCRRVCLLVLSLRIPYLPKTRHY